jgi:hypothetical protein
MPFILSEYLDKIEGLIVNNKTNIILCHYPLMTLWSSRSVVNSFKKADFVLTGHTHPSHSQIRHYGNLLSVICPPVAYTNFGGLVTIEEGGFVWHEFSPMTEDLVVVTFPVPLMQLYPAQIFNENSFPVRVLSFSVNPLTLSLVIDGKSYGMIPVIRKCRPHVWFYSLGVQLSNGLHQLSISGASFQEFEFFIGPESPKIAESALDLSSGLTIGFAVFFGILCLLKLIPWWIPLASHIDEFAIFLNFGTGDIPWQKQLYLGPLYLWSRLRNVPLVVFAVLWFALLWPLVIPFYITRIESTVAVLWCWGYIAKGDHFKFNLPLMLLMAYFLIIIIPLLNITGTFYEGTRLCLAQMIEIGLFCLPIIAGIVAWFLITVAAGGAFTVFTSPGLYIILGQIGFVIGKSVWDFKNRVSKVEMEIDQLPPKP